MSLQNEILTELVPKILEKDQKAFEIFYEEYGNVVKLHASKWLWSIQKASMNLYDFEDVENEFWEHILSRLHYFDGKRSSITTFLYMVCNTAGLRITNHYNRKFRNPGNELTPISLDIEYGEDEDLKLLDIITDPVNTIENNVISEISLFEDIYLLKDFIQKLSYRHQIVYLHMVKGLTLQESADVLCVTRQAISATRKKIQERIFCMRLLLRNIDYVKSDQFTISLLSNKSDDEVSDELQCDLAIVKICREILAIADLYGKSKEVLRQ